MIITFVYSDMPAEINTSIHRCFTPAKAINRSGKAKAALLPLLQFNNHTEMAENYCSHSEIIVVERNLFGETLGTIQYWKDKGKIIVANFDDAYDLIKPNNISYRFWRKGESKFIENGKEVKKYMSPVPLEQFKIGLKMCHAAVMPSRVLVKDWAKYTDTYYLPNYLETWNYVNRIQEKDPDKIVIGWAGSLGHLQSFEQVGLCTVLARIARQRDNVHILIGGLRQLYDTINLPEGKKAFVPFVPFEDYPGLINNFDIGLAPLCGSYDSRRSWLKPLEYMTMKIPWIGSDNIAYRELLEYGCLVKNEPLEWERAITHTIDRIDTFRKMAAMAPYEFAVKQDADARVDDILGVFEEIYSKSKGK